MRKTNAHRLPRFKRRKNTNLQKMQSKNMTLLEKYKKEVVPSLMKELKISNPMAVPKLVKIVVNCGLGEALRDKKALEGMSTQLTIITGQKPKVTRAKRAISTFKLRAGDPIGLK